MAVVPADKLAVHFHDTYGQALANILVSLQVIINNQAENKSVSKACCPNTVSMMLLLPDGDRCSGLVGVGPWRVPVRQGRHGQRGDRGRGVHAPRSGDRDQRRPRQAHGRWRLHLQAPGPAVRLQDCNCSVQANGLTVILELDIAVRLAYAFTQAILVVVYRINLLRSGEKLIRNH